MDFCQHQVIGRVCAVSRYQIDRAVHQSNQNSVLIKTNSSKNGAKLSLDRDYAVLRRFDSTNIIKAYGIEQQQDDSILVLENFVGQNLAEFIELQDVSLASFFPIAIQLAQALVDIHAQGIVYQNMQPECILIDPVNLELKIVDFSLATDTTSKTISPERLSELNLSYIAPEQTGRMNLTADLRVDFYALGILLYRLLAGVLPFQADSNLELIHCHLAQTPKIPLGDRAKIPKIVWQTVLKLLAKNPEERYQSASALVADLQNCQQQYVDKGIVDKFELGTLDLYSQFKISTELYGLSTPLKDALDLILAESEVVKLIWVTGVSGIGKTTLIERATPTIAEQPVYLIQGRFEYLTDNTPYKAIIQALRELIQQLLIETLENRRLWRSRIQEAIGDNAQIITSILPELELIIDSPPNVPVLGAEDSQNRFNLVFVKFLQVFTRSERPLVLLFDNCQWADVDSLNLLELLLNDPQSKHLRILGAYRGEEVVGDHPLIETINSISLKVQTHKIALEPYTIDETNSLLTDTFNCQPAESLALARLLDDRTHGNPFFINQLLETLYREKLISFDFTTLNWQWCLSKIQTASLTNYNILELVCNNFNQLPSPSQRVLKLAACLGDRFELDRLADVWNETAQCFALNTFVQDSLAVAQNLDYALKAGIIIKSDAEATSYQFLHDRVYQTVYSLLEQDELVQFHWGIGQFLLRQDNTSTASDEIFALVHHLNIGRQLPTSSLDLDNLVNLNLAAGRKAKTNNAYEAAANYLEVARSLLPNQRRQDEYSRMLAVYLESAEIQYLLGNHAYAEQLSDTILSQADTALEKVRVYKTKIHTHIAQNQMQLAIDMGLYALKLLDIYLPDSSTASPEYTIRLDINEHNIETLRNLPEMTDCTQIMAMEILTLIVPPVYIFSPQLLPLLVAKQIDLCLQHGKCSFSAYTYALYGLLLCSTGNIETGYKLGELAIELLEEFNAWRIASKVNFLVNNTIRHWRESATNVLKNFLLNIESGIKAGDIEHACFNAKYYCIYLFFVGEHLPTAESKTLQQIEKIAQFKQVFQLNYAQIWHQLYLNLQGLGEDKLLLIGEHFDEREMLPVWKQVNNATSLFAFYLTKTILCFFLEDYQQAIAFGRQAHQYIDAAVGTMCCSEYYFYYSLAILASCPTASVSDSSSLLPEVREYQQKIQHWASHAPKHYQHKYELVSAEIARVVGEKEQAAIHYEQAIIEADKIGYIHLSSLAEELTGKFYLSLGRTKIASYFLADACQGYRHWGALEKVRQLESKHFAILNLVARPQVAIDRSDLSTINDSVERSCSLNFANLDLLSIVKASQAISSEIILDDLLSKMMAIVMENAGAQKSILLLEQDSAWIVAAVASVDWAEKVSLPQVSLYEYQNVPNSIFNYIQSTRTTVILEQAAETGMFINDPYIVEHQSKSILCSPIIYQDRLQGIIYLENNLISGAFTAEKLSVLQVLLSQVSISIANAQLYKELKNHASVQKSLKQKEILLKEIHHRVKNNLFVVSSLLDFQSSYVDNPEIIKLLENCQNRITAMAIVHQHLYGNSNLDRINFAQYVESLIENLAYSQGCKDRNINLILDLEPIELNIESANPCGLIVNELISNALEHGFTDCNSGNVWLKLKRDSANQVVLSIQDDGVGFKPGLDLYNSDSLGLELVCTLVEQIDGDISLDTAGGSKIEIVFNELDYRSRI